MYVHEIALKYLRGEEEILSLFRQCSWSAMCSIYTVNCKMHALYLLLDHNVVTMNQNRAGQKIYFVKIHGIQVSEYTDTFSNNSVFKRHILEISCSSFGMGS
jgi:hypothetical protein